ncbi:MAG: alpha/beta hydrolase [Gammaproteobacteria bacterium]
MKKFLKIVAVIVVLVPLLGYGWLSYSAKQKLAAPADDALAILVTDDAVSIAIDDWVVMRPAAGAPKAGMILYPGAYCDVRGYSHVMKAVAAKGYLVVGVLMPFNMSIMAPDSADDVRAAFPEVDRWVIAGHSLGGAMAGRYAFNHQDELAGLILWDSYPPDPNSLGDSSLPVASILRARPDGSISNIFEDKRHLVPVNSARVAVPGGNHMNFGSFKSGTFVEEWDPSITKQAQHEIVTAATLQALAEMTGS